MSWHFYSGTTATVVSVGDGVSVSVRPRSYVYTPRELAAKVVGLKPCGTPPRGAHVSYDRPKPADAVTPDLAQPAPPKPTVEPTAPASPPLASHVSESVPGVSGKRGKRTGPAT